MKIPINSQLFGSILHICDWEIRNCLVSFENNKMIEQKTEELGLKDLDTLNRIWFVFNFFKNDWLLQKNCETNEPSAAFSNNVFGYFVQTCFRYCIHNQQNMTINEMIDLCDRCLNEFDEIGLKMDANVYQKFTKFITYLQTQ